MIGAMLARIPMVRCTRSLVWCACLCVTLSLTWPAGAADTWDWYSDKPTERATEPPVRRVALWYGHWLLVADLGCLVLTSYALGKTEDATAPLYTWPLYAAAGGLIHAAHGQDARTIAPSVALRIGLPLVGGLAGYAAADNATHGITGLTTGLGILVGVVVASAVDMAILAHPPAHLSAALEPQKSPRWTAAPVFMAVGDGWQAGAAIGFR